MNKKQIKSKLNKLVETFLEESFDVSSETDSRSALHIIVSNSIQAIYFVTLIESEFEIEFDDEEIDFDFWVICFSVVIFVKNFDSIQIKR